MFQATLTATGPQITEQRDLPSPRQSGGSNEFSSLVADVVDPKSSADVEGEKPSTDEQALDKSIEASAPVEVSLEAEVSIKEAKEEPSIHLGEDELLRTDIDDVPDDDLASDPIAISVYSLGFMDESRPVKLSEADISTPDIDLNNPLTVREAPGLADGNATEGAASAKPMEDIEVELSIDDVAELPAAPEMSRSLKAIQPPPTAVADPFEGQADSKPVPRAEVKIMTPIERSDNDMSLKAQPTQPGPDLRDLEIGQAVVVKNTPVLRNPISENFKSQFRNVSLEPGTLTVRLRPDGLGLVEVEVMKLANGEIEVSLRAKNPLVLDALRQDRQAISELITDSGNSMKEGSLKFDGFSSGNGSEKHSERKAAKQSAPLSVEDPEEDVGSGYITQSSDTDILV